jgi:hypothetical protein
MRIETDVIKSLADAIDACFLAASKTRLGFVDDYCQNAVRELTKAIAYEVSLHHEDSPDLQRVDPNPSEAPYLVQSTYTPENFLNK